MDITLVFLSGTYFKKVVNSAPLIWDVKSYKSSQGVTLIFSTSWFLFELFLIPEGVLGAFTNENPKCNIHPMHIMQDNTFTVYSIYYLVLWWRNLLRFNNYKGRKHLSEFLSRSFQDISCLNEVIIFIAKRNYFVDFVLTVKLLSCRWILLCLKKLCKKSSLE